MIKLHCHIAKVDEIRENFKHSIPVTDQSQTTISLYPQFCYTLQSKKKLNLQNITNGKFAVVRPRIYNHTEAVQMVWIRYGRLNAL